MDTAQSRGYRRIATEEAWCTPELMTRFQRLLDGGTHGDPGFQNLWGFFAKSQTPRARDLYERIQDIGMVETSARMEGRTMTLVLAPSGRVFRTDVRRPRPERMFCTYTP